MSLLKQTGTAVKKFISKKAREKMHEIKPQKSGKETIRLIKPNLPNKQPPLSDELKKALQKEVFDLKETRAKITPSNAYEVLDASLEGFFYNREYNIENFNLLLRMLASRGKIDEALGALEKMKIMDIKPTRTTYIQLIVASGKANDTETAENVFDKAIEQFGHPDGTLYTTLLSSYRNLGNHEYIEALINEKKAKGFKITPCDWTCYMHSLIKADLAEKAIEVYKRRQTEVVLDEYMITMAITACGRRNEAEYAKQLWGDMQVRGFSPINYHYNEIIMALAKRKAYAEEALDIYKQMRGNQITPCKRTFHGVLTACSRLGDLIAAQHALIDMKTFGIELDHATYQLLLSTYAEACLDASESAKDVFIKESWELFKQCEERGIVDIAIVDGLLNVHTKSYRENQVEGLVLPIYEEYGLKKGKTTYRALMKMYSALNEPDIVFKLWDTCVVENIKPDMYILNSYLENTLKVGNTDRAIEALYAFKENKLRPLYWIIKKIHQMDDKPLALWAAIQEFPTFYTQSWNKDYGERLRVDKVEERFTS